MGVQDPPGIGVVDRLVEHGAEAGHHHHVDVRGPPGRRPPPRSRPARSKPAPNPPKSGPVDQDRGDPAPGGHLEGPAGSVDQHHGHREVGGEDGLEDGAAARRQHARCCTLEATVGSAAGDHGRTLPAGGAGPGGGTPSDREVEGGDRGRTPVPNWRVRTPPDRPATGRAERPGLAHPPVPSLHLLHRHRSRNFLKQKLEESSDDHARWVQPSPTWRAGRRRPRLSPRASGARPRRRWSGRGGRRRRTPTAPEPAADGSGTATTRIRAALAAMAPLNESSTARQAPGSTPSLAAVER